MLKAKRQRRLLYSRSKVEETMGSWSLGTPELAGK